MTGGRAFARRASALLAIALAASACGGGGATSMSSVAVQTASLQPTPPPAAGTASLRPTPPDFESSKITLGAPAEVPAGKEFNVIWTGSAAPGDYLTIVPKGATTWTNEPKVGTSTGNLGKLTAPVTAGEYEIWFVERDTGDSIKARRAITVR